MKSHHRDLSEGLGLCILALLVGGLFVYGAVVVALDAKYARAAIFAVLGLASLGLGIRMTLGELARYRSSRGA